MRFLICITLIFNTSCIHTKSNEIKQVELEKEKNTFTNTLLLKNLEIKSIVYSETKFPLSDFFNRLMEGEFKESIKQANLNFKPSNTENEIMHDLLGNGIVPAHVFIKNVSNNEIKLSFKQFYLSNGNERHVAFNPDYLPNEIKQFSPTAVAANVYNFTVVVTITFMIALLLSPISHYSSGPYGGGYHKKKDDIFNETDKTIRIDYKNYVISEKILRPGEETNGLIFFNLKKLKNPHNYYLEFSF